MAQTGPEGPQSTSGGSGAEEDRRLRILHRELERRLEYLDEADDSVFGRFTAIDWTVCTVLFFVLPLVIAWLAL